MTRSTLSFLVVNVIYLTLVVAVVAHAYSLPGEGGLVPLVIGIPTVLMGLVSMIRRLRLEPNPSLRSEESVDEDSVAPWSSAWPVAAWLAALVVLVFMIGFYISILLFALAYLRFSARVGWFPSAALALILWGVIYLSFAVILQRSLFEGVLFGAILPLL